MSDPNLRQLPDFGAEEQAAGHDTLTKNDSDSDGSNDKNQRTEADSGSDEGSGGDEAAGAVVDRSVTQEHHEVHYHYHGNVYHGDVVWTKADVKDSVVEKIGGPSTAGPPIRNSPLPALMGAPSPAAPEFPGEGRGDVGGSQNLPGPSTNDPPIRDTPLPARMGVPSPAALEFPGEGRGREAGGIRNMPGSLHATATSPRSRQISLPEESERHSAHQPMTGPSPSPYAEQTSRLSHIREGISAFSFAEEDEETAPKVVGGMPEASTCEREIRQAGAEKEPAASFSFPLARRKPTRHFSRQTGPSTIYDERQDYERIDGSHGLQSTHLPGATSRSFSVQTTGPISFDIECQTSEKITRDRLLQTESWETYDTEAQTDKPKTRQRHSQTDPRTDIDTQTPLHKPERQIRPKTYSDMALQTDPPAVKEFAAQVTIPRKQMQKQVQTITKTFTETEFQTDVRDTAEFSSQTTSEDNFMNNMIKFASEMVEKYVEDNLSVELIDMYEKEDGEILREFRVKWRELLPPLQQVWKRAKTEASIQALERQLAATDANVENLPFITLGYEMAKREMNNSNEDDLLMPFTAHADDVYKMGEDFASEKHYLHVVIAFNFAAKLHKLINNGDTSVRGIRSCVYQVRLVVISMTKQESMKKIALDHVIPLMREMMGLIQIIRGSTHKVKVDMEARCLYIIGVCYGYCGENQQCADVNESAIDLMKTELKEEADKFKVYGHCLHNAGSAYGNLGNYKKAVEKYRMALEVYERVDWPSEEDKKYMLDRTTENLQISMKKPTE